MLFWVVKAHNQPVVYSPIMFPLLSIFWFLHKNGTVMLNENVWLDNSNKALFVQFANSLSLQFSLIHFLLKFCVKINY